MNGATGLVSFMNFGKQEVGLFWFPKAEKLKLVFFFKRSFINFRIYSTVTKSFVALVLGELET